MRAARSVPATTAGADRIVSSGAAWYAGRQAGLRARAIAAFAAPRHRTSSSCDPRTAPSRSGNRPSLIAAAGCNAAHPMKAIASSSSCRSGRTTSLRRHHRDIPCWPAHLPRAAGSMITSAPHCISHDHAEALGMSLRITNARFIAARDARQIALTGLERFGTLSRK